MDKVQGLKAAASETTVSSRRYFVCPYVKHAVMTGRPHDKVCPSGRDFESMAALKRHLNTTRAHNKKFLIQNCKRCKAYFINSSEHASHEALLSCPSNPISKGEENLAMRYRRLYKTLFPDSPVPVSPFFDDCMSKEQYKAEISQNSHSSGAIQPTKATVQPSTILPSTPLPSPSPCLSSAVSSSHISQDTSSSSTGQPSLSQRTERTPTNLTAPSSGSSAASNISRNTHGAEQHDEAQMTFLERRIFKRLSTIQSAMLQHSYPSTPQTILVLRQLDAGLSELEGLLAHTLHVSSEPSSPQPRSNIYPDPPLPWESAFSTSNVIQAADYSSTPTNVASVNPQQQPIPRREPGSSNESEGSAPLNRQQQQQALAISSAESATTEEGTGVSPKTSPVFPLPRKRKRERREQNDCYRSTSPLLPLFCDTDLTSFPPQPQPFHEALSDQWMDIAALGPNSFDLPSRNDTHLPGRTTDNHFDDSAWQQLDLFDMMEPPLFRWDGGLEDGQTDLSESHLLGS